MLTYTIAKKRILLSCCVMVLLGSCTNSDDQQNTVDTVTIDPTKANESVKLSEFVDSVKYIKLQTDSNTIIGRAVKITVKQKYIYVVDASQMSILLFNKKGEFVSKLDKKGKGPDEYQYIGGIFIDDDEKYIELFAGDKLMKYANVTFELLNERPAPLIFANSFRKFEGCYYFATQQIANTVNDKRTNAGILIEKDGEIVKTLFDQVLPPSNLNYSYNSESFTINKRNELFVSVKFDNTFYQLRNRKAFPVLSVDFGNYSLDDAVVKATPKTVAIKNRIIIVILKFLGNEENKIYRKPDYWHFKAATVRYKRS